MTTSLDKKPQQIANPFVKFPKSAVRVSVFTVVDTTVVLAPGAPSKVMDASYKKLREL